MIDIYILKNDNTWMHTDGVVDETYLIRYLR
jgi:hypothetical protein